MAKVCIFGTFGGGRRCVPIEILLRLCSVSDLRLSNNAARLDLFGVGRLELTSSSKEDNQKIWSVYLPFPKLFLTPN